MEEEEIKIVRYVLKPRIKLGRQSRIQGEVDPRTFGGDVISGARRLQKWVESQIRSERPTSRTKPVPKTQMSHN